MLHFSLLRRLPLLAGSLLVATSGAAELRPPDEGAHVLWYDRPATAWVEALPLGNGRLGAMVFGGVDFERIQLNEDTIWAGGPYDPTHDEARPALPEVRRLVRAGQFTEAQKLADERLRGRPASQAPYQPLGDLLLTFAGGDALGEYRRELDLDSAVARARFTLGGGRFTREMFISPVAQVLAIRLTAEGQWSSLEFTAGFETPQPNATTSANGQAELVLTGTPTANGNVAPAIRFESRARFILEGGYFMSGNGRVRVAGAKSVTILLAAATNFRTHDDLGADPAALVKARLDAAVARGYDALLADHVAEHRRLFRRSVIALGTSPAGKEPTDVRIRESARRDDPELAALAYHFGRYLLICSSRPGTQPANLQGIWNSRIYPPWQSKYTININTEMNYWPAESTHLEELHQPLFQLIRELSQTGRRTASRHYGASGWVAHHNTDIWRASAPIDPAFYGLWPTGGAWLSLHLWEHFLYGLDRGFLAEAYPALRGATEFFLDTLIEDRTGRWLLTSPSISPENAHHPGVSIAEGPAMDQQILRDLFAATARASAILRTDEAFRARVLAARARLAPDKVGRGGQLQEWQEDWDLEAPEREHRHVSHLFGLFPSTQINRDETPDLFAAARRSLELRGDFATGWGIGWRINLWARLRDGDRALQVLRRLLQPDRSYPNMFDAHPPFQIDGNLGATAGVAEMLLQSRLAALAPEGDPASLAFDVFLLPALPSAWGEGSVTGLRARGGFTLDLAWQAGRLREARVVSSAGQAARFHLGDRTVKLELAAGETRVLTPADFGL